MDKAGKSPLIRFWIVGFVFLAAGYLEATDGATHELGDNVYKVCREDNVTFAWPRPENATIKVMDLTFIPDVPDNVSNHRDLIWSLNWDGTHSVHGRYLNGRIEMISRLDEDYLKFKLVNVFSKDRGKYELFVMTDEFVEYEGTADLTVYGDDNLWPNMEKVNHPPDDQEEVVVYRYPFVRPNQSPVQGMRMSVSQKGSVVQICQFGNTSRCEIVFTSEDLEGLSGIVPFEVTPMLKNNSLLCPAIKKSYDYTISIMREQLSSTLVGGICVSVFIAIAACVIPPVIIHVKNKREKYIPLRGGYDFLKGCIARIEATPDISDVYRKNANSKMIHPHVKGYFQDTKDARELFFQDEGLTKIYFAAFIKYYISNVCDPLLSLDYIQKIKHSEKDSFKVEEVREYLTVKKKDSRRVKYRKRILRLLFQHFNWFRQRKIEADGSDSEEQSPTKILTTVGLASLLAMNFDRTKETADMEEFNRMAKLTRFLRNLIIECDEIFGSREETNGNVFVSLDQTSETLLDCSV